jgi:hypothetical protein
MLDSLSVHLHLYHFLLQAFPQIKVKGQLVVRTDIDVNEQRDYPTLHLDIN